MKLRWFFILLMGFIGRSNAQIDTSFWFVAPNISAIMGDTSIRLHFQSYAFPTVIFISQPANPSGISTSLSIPANSLITYNLSNSLTVVESSPTNSVSNKGIYISAKDPISVYYSLGAPSNREMIGLKGSKALGTDFYVPVPTASTVSTYTVPDGGIGFDVVATQTGVTTILITPRANCVGHTKNNTFARVLNYGQSFSVRDNNSVNPTELSGSIVSSDKPIAVTINGPVRTGTGCPSYFAEQITASSSLGKEYVVLKGKSQVDLVNLLSPFNATSFTVTGSSGNFNWLINAGETYSFQVQDTITYVQASRPLYLIHTTGFGCKLSSTQLPPAFCAGSYSAAFTRRFADTLQLNIVTRNGFQNSFTLSANSGSVPLPASSFSPVPGSGGALVAARVAFSTLNIPVGANVQLRNSRDMFGLSLLNGNSVNGSDYATASEFAVQPFVIANVIPTATICTNTQINLSGIIGGGPINGYWSVLNGFGSLTAPAAQFTNNTYIPAALDTLIQPVKLVLYSTGSCPNRSDTLKLTVKQAPIVEAGSDFISCTNLSTLQLNGNVYGSSTQGIWQVLAPGSGSFNPSSSVFNPVYAFSAGDQSLNELRFVLTSTNNGGCNPVSDTLRIQLKHPVQVSTGSVSPVFRCANNTSLALNGFITGTLTSTGFWSSSGTGVFAPNNLFLSNTYFPSSLDVLNGSVWLKLKSTNNQECLQEADSLLLTFTQAPQVNAGPDLNSCVNNPTVNLGALISGSATSTGIWYGGNGSFLPNASSPNATYIATAAEISAGTVALSFSTTNNGLCQGAGDQLTVSFQAKPVANFTANSVCLNQNTVFQNLSFNPPGIGVVNGWYWDFGDGSPVTSSVNPVHLYASPGTYSTQLIVRNNFNCYDTVSKTLDVYTLPVADFRTDRQCEGPAQRISFFDQSNIALPDSIPAGNYYWDFGGGGISRAKDTAIIFPTDGVYSITHVVTSNRGCSSLMVRTITVSPRPEARFVYSTNNAPGIGAYVQFNDTSEYAAAWHWEFGNGDTSNLEDPQAYYSSNGTYTVVLTVSDVYGCKSTFTSEVTVLNIVSEIAELIPNIITPNFDGKNDLWRLDFIQVFYPKAEIEIFNRWGVKLFRSEGYSNAWDGTYKGDPLPVGAYYYTIRLNDPADTPVIKGTVTLLK